MIKYYNTIFYWGYRRKQMILYITIAEVALEREEKKKIKNMLQEGNYSYKCLGTYRSRNYSTIVIDFQYINSDCYSFLALS
jgi:hypothetical protein